MQKHAIKTTLYHIKYTILSIYFQLFFENETNILTFFGVFRIINSQIFSQKMS